MAEDAIIRGDLPVAGGGEAGSAGGPGQDAGCTVEQELSAAGPAPGVEVARGAAGGRRLVFEQAGVRVNPAGYNWEEHAFTPWTEGKRLEGLWKRWRGAAVRGGGGGGDVREGLDAWQGFAHDVVEEKRVQRGMTDRERAGRTGRRANRSPSSAFCRWDDISAGWRTSWGTSPRGTTITYNLVRRYNVGRRCRVFTR